MIAQWVLPILMVQMFVLGINLWHFEHRRRLLRTKQPSALPRVSILIPIRNERQRLPELVCTLRSQHGSALEVILCDDHSEDGSTEWLRCNLPMHQHQEPLSWFPAPPIPQGWVGKNWACYQLAQRAQGEWLVFLDADMRLHHRSLQLLGEYLAQFDKHTVWLVSAIPTLRAPRLLIGLLESMVPFSVFTLLPLPLAENHLHPAFAFANGQIMAFPRDYYQQAQPHERVHQAILEDVQIARQVKSQAGKIRILDVRDAFEVTMYLTLSDAMDGFSKNATAICGSIAAAVVVALMLAWTYLAPLAEAMLYGASWWHVVDYILSMVLFAVSGRMAGLPLWFGCLYPITLILGEWTLWRSISWYARGKIRWKGRTYLVR